MRPRLRPHVQITRQHYRGRRWHVVHDPSSNSFFRLSPVGHEFVGLFDGRRTVEEIWQLGLTRHGDEALTQNEVIQLLSQLHSGNLMAGDAAPETEQLLTRGRDRLQQKITQQAIGLMYFKVRLFNPDHILAWIEPILRPILGKTGFVLWLLWVVAAFVAIIPHIDELRNGFDSAMAPANWPLMFAVFVCIKLWHELGHGVICKRFGGQVPEFGAMMLVLVPAPFVDASAAWNFASKWQRMAVGAGGMIFELAAAGLCAFLWLNTGPGDLLHQIAYNAMLSASVSTILFNANPLMRFDGYYILSDLLEIPNLQQRSFSMLKFLLQFHAYRMKSATPPTSSPGEALWLIAYGVGSGIYRVVLFVSITLYLVGKMFAIGVFLAAWTAAMWFILPVGQCIHWLSTSQNLSMQRGRAVATSLALLLTGVLLVGAVPMPDHRRAVGVIESEHQAGVYFRVDAFVKAVHVKPGQRVKAGDPILTCESDQLEAQIGMITAQLREAASKEREAKLQSEAAAQVAARFIQTMEEQLRYLTEKRDKLVVRAPQDGVLVGPELDSYIGRFVREGQGAAAVVELDQLRATATLTQQEAWIYELPADRYSVELRRASDPSVVIPAKFERTSEAGDRELPHPSLGYGGGGAFETESRDQTGMVAKSPVLKAYFTSAIPSEQGGPSRFALGEGEGARPGERVYFRFTLPSKPWLFQWVDEIRKKLQGRARL
jgi:putative peptide zinc metalloprotease protein